MPLSGSAAPAASSLLGTLVASLGCGNREHLILNAIQFGRCRRQQQSLAQREVAGICGSGDAAVSMYLAAQLS